MEAWTGVYPGKFFVIVNTRIKEGEVMPRTAGQIVKTWEGRQPNRPPLSAAAPAPEGDYLEPAREDILLRQPDIDLFLGSGRVSVIVPMKEREPVVSFLLDTITGQVSSQHIWVIDDGSGEAALDAVRGHPGVCLFRKNEVLDLLDWDALLPILCLERRPEGKGAAVMAGHILSFAQALASGDAPSWIVQHDSDVIEYGRNRGLDYLAWAILNSPADVCHVKMAQPDRDNEPTMNARNSLLALARLCETCHGRGTRSLARRARDLFTKLSPLKWMLSGQFALSWELAMSRPFASGYLEETLICALAADKMDHGGSRTVQVANPNPCLDGADDFVKTAVILQAVSNFLFYLVACLKPTDAWGIGDIQRMNELMAQETPMSVIPPHDGPVLIETVPDERIMPSIKTLKAEGWLDMEAARRLIT